MLSLVRIWMGNSCSSTYCLSTRVSCAKAYLLTKEQEMELENYLQMRAYGSGVLFDEDICR